MGNLKSQDSVFRIARGKGIEGYNRTLILGKIHQGTLWTENMRNIGEVVREDFHIPDDQFATLYKTLAKYVIARSESEAMMACNSNG